MLFFPDVNHDATTSLFKLRDVLSDRYTKGYRVLFVEFLYRNPPIERRDLEDQFREASGGRAAMIKDYCDVIALARQIGFRVVGLSLPEYYPNLRSNLGASIWFRNHGGFDSIAAEIIQQEAQPKEALVFLGAGHIPLLRNFLPFDVDGDPGGDSGSGGPPIDSQDQKLANDFANKWLTQVVQQAVQCAPDGYTIRYQGRGLSFPRSANRQDFEKAWQDKVGLPMPTSRGDRMWPALRDC